MNLTDYMIEKANDKNIVVGVTGSMGCGKTYACNMLTEIADSKNLSSSYIDFDTVRRYVLSAESKYEMVRSELVDTLGNSLKKSDGSICGIELGQTIFYDISAMLKFKTITYPAIVDSLKDEINKNKGLSFLEWALLAEDDLVDLVEGNVLVLTCDYDSQMKRLSKRDLPKGQFRKRVANQMVNDEKIKHIKNYQKSKGIGNLYILDTTFKPSKDQYTTLLENIIEDIA